MQVNVKKLFDEFASYDKYGNRRLREGRAIVFAEAYHQAMLKAAPKPPIADGDLIKDAERYRYIRTKVKMFSAAKNAPPTFVVTIFNDLVGIDLTQGNKAQNFDDAVDVAKFTSNLKSKRLNHE